ncbi:MAG: nucleotidyltransferase domain-containing protein [Bacilli bacterium]|nr:nucleotidyltransferase domain-containing protein [Bacilli bacterium]
MAFNQSNYIANYNKENYKMYQFRVKKTNNDIINYLDDLENRNSFLIDLINDKINNNVYTLKEIKSIIKPILQKHGIFDIYLFGSYARGEANNESDVDIYCEKGNIRNLIDQENLIGELEKSLNKKVDIVFNTSYMDDYFKQQIMEDMIKLC